jgi:hypothetical protein
MRETSRRRITVTSSLNTEGKIPMRGKGKGWAHRREKSMRRITVTSSLNEISTDQLGIRMVVREGGVTPPTPMHSFLHKASGQIFKDDVNDFPLPLIFASWGRRTAGI